MPKRSKYVKPRRFNIALIPIMAVLGVVPLIVFAYNYSTGLEDKPYMDSEGRVDFFLAWKLYVFTAVVFAMACVIIYKLYREGKKIRFEKIFIPLGVYATLAFLSGVFSDYPHIAFTGGFEQFESTFALVGYSVTAYYAFLFVETEKDLKLVLAALTFSVICMMLIGLSQAFFTDFYQTSLGKHLILPISQWSTAHKLEFTFEKGRVYMSLYNPNYVGSYVSFLFPVYMMLAFNKWKYRFVLAPASIAVGVSLILVLLGSGSRSGFIGVAISVVFLLIVMIRKLFRYIVPITFVVLLFISVVHKMDMDSDRYYSNRLFSAFNREKAAEPNFSDVSADGDELLITYCGNTLHIEFDYDVQTGNYSFHLTDDAGVGIEGAMGEEDWIVPSDERFSDLKLHAVGLEMYNTAGFGVVIDGKEWYFMNSDTGVKMLSPQLKPTAIRTSETFGPLVGRENMASGRGFIWGKTIPLLKDKIFLGSGADTFVTEFPNDDYRATYYGGYLNTMVTKPHNMYLQIGVQTGVLSLIAVLAFYGWYFVLAVVTYFRIKKLDMFGFTGLGILCGSFGYMITQIINDSSITVAPIFWTMMGVGIALLMKTRKDLKAELAEAKMLREQRLAERQAAFAAQAINGNDSGIAEAVNRENFAADVTPAPAPGVTDVSGVKAGDAAESVTPVSESGETDAENSHINDQNKESIGMIREAKEGVSGNGSNKNGRKGSAARRGKRSHR